MSTFCVSLKKTSEKILSKKILNIFFSDKNANKNMTRLCFFALNSLQISEKTVKIVDILTEINRSVKKINRFNRLGS